MNLLFQKAWHARFKPLLGTTLFLILQGCSNTRFGEQLANSFDAPQNSLAEEVDVASRETRESITPTRLPTKENKKSNSPTSKKGLRRLNPEIPRVVRNPLPYRITIKLSEADPSAPAEALTKALRMAGVRFEVERIELLKKNNLSKRSNRIKGATP